MNSGRSHSVLTGLVEAKGRSNLFPNSRHLSICCRSPRFFFLYLGINSPLSPSRRPPHLRSTHQTWCGDDTSRRRKPSSIIPFWCFRYGSGGTLRPWFCESHRTKVSANKRTIPGGCLIHDNHQHPLWVFEVLNPPSAETGVNPSLFRIFCDATDSATLIRSPPTLRCPTLVLSPSHALPR